VIQDANVQEIGEAASAVSLLVQGFLQRRLGIEVQSTHWDGEEAPADRQYFSARSVYVGMGAVATVGAGVAEREELDAAVREFSPRLRSFVRRRIGDWSEAEDVAQDVLTELSAAWLMQPVEHVFAWLTRVARNRIIDRYRARERESQVIVRAASEVTEDPEEPERLIDQWVAPAADEPEAAYERGRLLDELEGALVGLPAAQRAVFVAHEFEGKSFKDLAAASGESVNTLLGRKHAAVRALRETLRDWHDTPD
jgi:RNA polymerase sigma factor (sigma-70 family)